MHDRSDTHEQAATAVGEVSTLSRDQLTIIEGSFAAALAIPLHAGARVYVFIARDLDEHVGNFDALIEDFNDAEGRANVAQSQLKNEKKTTARLQRLLTAETARVAELTGPTA